MKTIRYFEELKTCMWLTFEEPHQLFTAAVTFSWGRLLSSSLSLSLSPRGNGADAGSAQTGWATYCCHDTGVKLSLKHKNLSQSLFFHFQNFLLWFVEPETDSGGGGVGGGCDLRGMRLRNRLHAPDELRAHEVNPLCCGWHSFA